MDPVTAVQVASAAITFLDFSIDVYKAYREIASHHGATKHNADVEAAVTTCKEMTEDLKAKRSNATSSQIGSKLDGAVAASIVASNELLALLQRIREAKDVKIIGPTKAVYLSLRYRQEVDRLQVKAEGCRTMVVQCLIQATWEEGALHHAESSLEIQGLDNRATEILAALARGSTALRDHFSDAQTHLDDQVSSLQRAFRDGNAEVLDRVNASQRQIDDAASGIQHTIKAQGDDVSRRFDELTRRVQDMAKPDVKKAFMDSLFFNDYQIRERGLSGPSPRTFEWIFDHKGGATPKRPNPRWPSFPQWLESADSSKQYWLSGKAGSGKSTLMAHIIRPDMALKRTKVHLEKWTGSKPLHVLSFFLFRPRGEVQAGLEHLLRSLLYQLLKSIPLMQEILMAQYVPPGSDGRAPTWPVSTLKSMLSAALDTADDCCFLIFIDGVDEFQDFQNLGEESFTPIALADLLLEVQKPAHVKLCISSRPELRIAQDHSSFVETRLADLNQEDIRIFVHDRIKAMAPIPLERKHESLAQQICDRADGIFLWAAFAVGQMELGRRRYGEDYFQLMKRLDGMGETLTTAIAHMLRSIEVPHRPAVAFYLQAMKSWKVAGIEEPLTVALIAASQSEGMQSRSKFLAACEREQRDIRNFSQGLIEVKSSFAEFEDDFLVKSHQHQPDEAYLLEETPDCQPGKGSWVTIAPNGHSIELLRYCRTQTSLIHRSAYDFFFAPEGQDFEHAERSRLLFSCNDESRVPSKLQAGLRKLLYIEPMHLYPKMNQNSRLSEGLQSRSATIISYTAKAPFTEGYLIGHLDELLTTTRLELLFNMVDVPVYENREHIPGDIFSRQMRNGCLQPLDHDFLLDYETEGHSKDVERLASLEAWFYADCADHENLNDYVHDSLKHLETRPSGCIVQALFLMERRASTHL